MSGPVDSPLVGRHVEVQVPASSANLGPGFDVLGLALSLYDHLSVETIDSGLEITVEGIGADVVPRDASHLVVRGIVRGFQHAGIPLPGLRLHAKNAIPHGGGLGSSAAAIVSGLLAAKGLLDGIFRFDANALLELATELEGHPDNVAPALFGGLTIAWHEAAGVRAKKLMVHRGVSPLVLIPDYSVATHLARSLQPQSVPTEDAVFNVSRSALLIAALVQSPELLFEATADRLHQSYRASAMPQTAGLVEQLRAAGYAAVVSGAGPSVLVLAPDPELRLAAAKIATERRDARWNALPAAVDFKGATVIARRVEAAKP